MGEAKIYVGDLSRDASEKDLERAFGYYGPLKSVWVARNPAGFAFLEFDDPRDAEDAVRGLDGTTVAGSRVRVEHATGKVRPKPWLRGGGGGGRDGGGRDGGGRDGGGRGGGGRGRRPFHPEDKCYECGGHGHYAYDCPRHAGGRRGGRPSRHSRSRSRSPRRRRSPSRSRSRSRSPVRATVRARRSKSRSKSQDRRSRSKSPVRRGSPPANGGRRESEER